ncbi:hypothetical protein QFZ27_007821 [Inquilinus ginsengisoli]|uniref:hypothetical protein n=1 Tax=Inquilinus ginsengisoli TaxID=363840 RepID=UPI003D217F32
MENLNTSKVFQMPRKLFWQDPLRLVAVIGFSAGFAGSMLEKQYPMAFDFGPIGWVVGIAAAIAIRIRKKSGRG